MLFRSRFAQAPALLMPDGTPGFALTIPAPPSWLVPVLCGVWASVSALLCLRLILNLRAVRRMAGSGWPLADARERRFDVFRAVRLGSRPAHVRVAEGISGACAVGFRRPSILLSRDLAADLDDEAIETIVLHEYAHLQRFDDWTRLLQQAVLAVAWFHPGVRWISRRIDIEREMACDRLVVDRTGAPLEYARSLTRAAEISARMTGLPRDSCHES